MAKFNFNLKDSKSCKPTVVFLIIRFNYQKLKYSTGESIKPSDWNSVTQRAKESRTFPEFPEFNYHLNGILAVAKTVFRQYLNDNDQKEPSVKTLKQLLDVRLRNVVVPTEVKVTFYDFVEKHIEDSKSRINNSTGRTLNPVTVRHYKATLNRIREFSVATNYEVDFETIDLVFYDKFTEFLSRERGLSRNSIGGHIKILKAWLCEATEKNFNKNLIFQSKRFKKTTEVSEAVYLNYQELDEIEKLDLSHAPKLDRVRDLFIVGCYSGLRFSDLRNLKRENIQENTIEVITAKTSERVSIPITKSIRKVLQKYEGKYANGLPPCISNTNMNKYIREFCELVDCLHCEIQMGITKGGVYTKTTYKKYELLSSHTCRRSFATNCYKMGLQPLTIMQVTGHKSSRVFEGYVKLSISQHSNMLQEEWTKRGLM